MDLAIALVVAVCTIGLSTLIWGVAGAVRLAAVPRRERRLLVPSMYFRAEEVAVLIAAHDEELVIADAVAAARTLVPARNVFVVSDGSNDATVETARAAGATAWDLFPNRGKAGAIREGLRRFRIVERFPLVMLLDADSRPRADYLRTGLPLFSDRGVVAVAGRATTAADAPATRVGRFLTAYRERTYVCTQYLHKFGQAARRADAVAIVPGFASVYRTDILDRVDIDAPGLSIEDFNMTFEVHAKRLGRIAFHPECAVAETQDPAVLRDYTAQVRRWSLGFWQTVRRHGVRRGVFWAALGVFATETVVSSLVLAAILPVLVVTALAALGGLVLPGESGAIARATAALLPAGPLVLGFVLVDVAMTLFACALSRTRPRASMLLYPLMRVLDAVLSLRALATAFGRPSDGRWRSPDRRPGVPGAAGAPAVASRSAEAATDAVSAARAGEPVIAADRPDAFPSDAGARARPPGVSRSRLRATGRPGDRVR